ncbi:Phage Terminase [Crateriforma conspicua]|uniref:Phage Terminase n=1 Tax=Crateriforma conspicua TaxID=2527996 RepID=A0A5C6FY76_9PLAN|nr:terminase TerL endonuclease subunit [Crateriforma conspicua]TWU67294.1 Phage Terminase [Crateriforma conspicua]
MPKQRKHNPTPARVHRLTAAKAKARREGWLGMIRSEADERAVLDGYYFCRQSADHCTEFFPKFLRHSKNRYAGQPFELLDWQRDDLLAPLFGWMKPEGLRRFTKVYVEIPKKNGKSTLVSGVGIYMLAFDGEPGAKCFSAATDKKQAKIVHDEAIAMINASERLQSVLRVNQSTSEIFYDAKNCVYSALSSVVNSKEGLDGHFASCDEMHAWNGYALWDCLKYMGRARDQPIIFIITTAGEEEEGVCWDQHAYVESIRDGTVYDPRYFGLIYSCTEDQLRGTSNQDGTPWQGLLDPELQKQANPSLGATINPGEFMADMQEAINTPRTIPAAMRYGFNVWCRTESVWLPKDAHDRNLGEYTDADMDGCTCFGGLDLGKTSDPTAVSLMFRDSDDPELYFRLNYFWLPEATAWDLRDKVDFTAWAGNPLNHLVLTEGDVADYARIRADIKALADRYDITDLAFDPWNATDMAQQLEAAGIKCVEFGQSAANFNEPTKEYERLITAGKMLHNGNDIIGWMTKHVRVKSDVNDNLRPIKPARDDVEEKHKKIDGIVTDLMALGRWLSERPPSRGAALIY